MADEAGTQMTDLQVPPTTVTTAPAKPADTDDDEAWLASLPANKRKYVKRLETSLNNLQGDNEKLKQSVAQLEKERKDQQDKTLAEQGEFKRLYEESLVESKRKDERLIRAELKILAQKAGILDPSDLDTVPLEGIEIAKDGSVAGAKERISALKASKPHWFEEKTGAAGESKPTTATTAADKGEDSAAVTATGAATTPPPPATGTQRDARKIKDPMEYEAAEQEFLASLGSGY